MATELEVRSNIIALLRAKLGVGVEFFGVLSIDELENGTYRVMNQEDFDKELADGDEYNFKDLKKAVDFFLDIRKRRRLGYDFGRK